MANCKDISNGIILTITYNFSDQLSYIFFHMMKCIERKILTEFIKASFILKVVMALVFSRLFSMVFST